MIRGILGFQRRSDFFRLERRWQRVHLVIVVAFPRRSGRTAIFPRPIPSPIHWHSPVPPRHGHRPSGPGSTPSSCRLILPRAETRGAVRLSLSLPRSASASSAGGSVIPPIRSRRDGPGSSASSDSSTFEIGATFGRAGRIVVRTSSSSAATALQADPHVGVGRFGLDSARQQSILALVFRDHRVRRTGPNSAECESA